MKVNLPVTGTERMLVPGRPVVTKTDLKGLIVYCNQAFIDISGFCREELLGTAHNIVRHPDMPPEAFADLWRTVGAGHPWRGIVKNRAKTGDHYWVDAYVTPVTDNGRCIGYMSVRTPAPRAEVAAAEAFYRAVREKRAQLPPTRLPSGCGRASRLGLGAAAAIAALSLGAGLLGGAAGIAAGVLGAALTATAALLFKYRFLTPLQHLAGALQQIDEGRLDHPIASPGGALDQVFSRLEAVRIHLRAMFADVLVSAGEVAERSGRLDQSMRNLTASSAAQTENVMRISAAMEEMSVAVTEISHNTEIALAAARRTEEVANAGMDSMAASMDSSRKAAGVVMASAQRISDVNASIGRIAHVSQIIREIADQTNLLALNAAIEAARAGEQGRGFAVVADEVRKLAERTATSTIEITTAVAEIVEQSKAAVDTMEEASREVTQGSARVEESSGGLREICTASQEAVRVSVEITDMLHQQSSTSQDVANGMEGVSSAADSANAAVVEVGDAATGLRHTAEELRQLLRHMESALTD